MKRKFKSISIILVLICILIFMLSNPSKTIESVLFGLNIWMYNVFPSLFPFFILSDLLINFGFVELLSKLFGSFMKVFGLSRNASYVYFLSFICGSPSGARSTRQLLDNNMITLIEANHLIKFTHSVNPLFVLGTVGSVLLNDLKLGFIILISILLGNLIIGVAFKINNNNAFNKNEIYNLKEKDNFVVALSNSIYNSLDILFLMLGIIIIFLIISSFVDSFNFNNSFSLIIKGILEMTQGVKLVSLSNFSLIYKVILMTFFLSFGGISVHMQVASVIDGTKIKYKNFLISRLIHSILSSILVFILFNVLY